MFLGLPHPCRRQNLSNVPNGCDRTRGVLLAQLLCLVALLTAPASSGSGGVSIAGAPDVTPWVTLNGNTSSDEVTQVSSGLGPGGSCPGDGEFWVVTLTKGDVLRLQGAGLAPAAQMWLDLYPPGTTDETLASASPVLSRPLGDATTTAARSGKYPVLIGTSADCGGTDGPFHFAALVTHEALVSLPRPHALTRTGTVSARVTTPDGQPLTDPHLVLTLQATYRHGGATRAVVLGRAAAVGGSAAFAYRLPGSVPPGEVTLTVRAKGAAYRPIRAATARVRLSG
jgi:hypothetical protein